MCPLPENGPYNNKNDEKSMNSESLPVPLPRVVAQPDAQLATTTHCWSRLPRYMLYSTLPIIASAYSLSSAVATMLTLPPEASLATKIAVPLSVWTPVAVASLWFQWYFNGRRADGLVDARVMLGVLDSQETPGLLGVALLASLPNLLDAVLYAYAIRPQPDAVFVLMAATLGVCKWLTWCLTDLQAAWRKLTEGTHIKPLSEQYWVKALYHNAHGLNILLREILPPVMGLVYLQAFFRAMQAVSAFPLVNGLLALLVYQGVALTGRNFQIRQNHDCSFGAAAFAMQGALAGADSLSLRVIGRLLNGQLLDDALTKLRLSAKVRTAITLTLNGLGFTTVLQRMLTTYVVSNNPVAVAKAQEAFVLRYYASEATALAVGQHLVPAVLPIAIALASVQAYVRAATVEDQILKDQRQPRIIQVVPVNG